MVLLQTRLLRSVVILMKTRGYEHKVVAIRSNNDGCDASWRWEADETSVGYPCVEKSILYDYRLWVWGRNHPTWPKCKLNNSSFRFDMIIKFCNLNNTYTNIPIPTFKPSYRQPTMSFQKMRTRIPNMMIDWQERSSLTSCRGKLRCSDGKRCYQCCSCSRRHKAYADIYPH